MPSAQRRRRSACAAASQGRVCALSHRLPHPTGSSFSRAPPDAPAPTFPAGREGCPISSSPCPPALPLLPRRGIVSTTRFYGPRPVKGRLTGRQMFEADASLVFSDAAAIDESEAGGGAGGGAGVPIDESLFLGGAELSDDDDSDFEPGSGEEEEEDGEDEDEE